VGADEKASNEIIERPEVDRWIRASTGREGTFWPGLSAAGIALVIAALLWPSAPRWSMWAIGWTALVVVIWVACVLIDRPPGRRPHLDPADYRSGDLPGQLLAAAHTDQLELSLMLFRSARTPDIARRITAEGLPAVRPPWPLHLFGRSWHECDPPRARHPCWPQTIGIRADDGTGFERCPCGGVRRRRFGSPWRQRNGRRAARPGVGVRVPHRTPAQPDR
jgi:hypothetical protein